MVVKTIDKLITEYGTKIPYYELLTCSNWFIRRREIITRDKNKCTVCGKLRQEPDAYRERIYYTKMAVQDFYVVPVKIEPEERIVKRYLPHIGDYFEFNETFVTETEIKNLVCLHVHHLYYVLSEYPWEYPDSALVTVCSSCHEDIHHNQVIPVYKDKFNGDKVDVKPCIRCMGQGVFPQYSHVQNGICFRCGGAKYEELIRSFDPLKK